MVSLRRGLGSAIWIRRERFGEGLSNVLALHYRVRKEREYNHTYDTAGVVLIALGTVQQRSTPGSSRSAFQVANVHFTL